MKQLTYKEALAKATAYCAKGEKSESDVIDKFHTWGVAGDDIQPIMDYLRNERYVDNSRFARAYALDKFRFNRWGRKKIAMMLSSKGIDKQIIGEALEVIDDGKYLEILATVLDEKNRTLSEPDTYRRRSKLFAFAMQRGFEPELIWAAIERL